MTQTEMLDSHPDGRGPVDPELLAAAVAACFECAQACTTCADACLAEEAVADLRRCIRSDLDCADVCGTTGRVLSRRTGTDLVVLRSLIETCAATCRACGDECASHAGMHEHCRICAEVCRRCERACRDLLVGLG